jgi:hypothetical protein
MTPNWIPCRTYKTCDRITCREKPVYPLERWAYRWIPPLRPLLRWIRERREEVEVVIVLTAGAASDGPVRGDGSVSSEGEAA